MKGKGQKRKSRAPAYERKNSRMKVDRGKVFEKTASEDDPQ